MAISCALELTQMESLYLSDSLSMFMQGPPDSIPGQASPYPTLLLKIGGAVLETDQQKQPVSVQFGLSELWVLRELTKSSVVMGSERVGLNLLLKVYAGIQALSAESDVHSAVSVFGEVVDVEPGKNEYATQLERIRNGGSPDSGGSYDEDRFDDAGGNNKPDNTDENRPDHDTATAA